MPNANEFPACVSTDLQATIASGGTTSNEVDLAGTTLVGLYIPSTFDGTTLTLTAAPTAGGTHVAVQIDHTSASSYTITTTASRYVPLANLAIPSGLRFIKLVAGSSQTTTDTVITLVTRPV